MAWRLIETPPDEKRCCHEIGPVGETTAARKPSCQPMWPFPGSRASLAAGRPRTLPGHRALPGRRALSGRPRALPGRPRTLPGRRGCFCGFAFGLARDPDSS
jgi:hypothetical protein